MTAQKHIYRVSFKEQIDGKNDYFYSSLSAIFTNFTPEQIGCGVRRLWNIKVTEENPYIGRKCTITREPLVRKKHGKDRR
jgi:hypothetical protein